MRQPGRDTRDRRAPVEGLLARYRGLVDDWSALCDADSVVVRYRGFALGTARARATGAGPVMVSELPKALRRTAPGGP